MPDFTLEDNAGGLVAGLDEAGRGPWAGPVVAAAVVFTSRVADPRINDSKKLSAAQRDALFDHITTSTHWAVGQASVEEIDRLNILNASLLAMQRALEALTVAPVLALVDGNKAPKLTCKTQTVVKGDSISMSIAAASIIAKVTRDRIMQELALEYPHYGWERNAGYGTKMHQDGLALHGITPHHRRSFAPIKLLLTEVAA